MKKTQNLGFSLIELVVIIAIMTTLTVGITLSLQSVLNRKVISTAEVIQSQLQYTQAQAMSKPIAYGEICLNADGTYQICLTYGTQGDLKTETRNLCSGREVDIYYKTNKDAAGSQGTKIDEAHPCVLSFAKSSGALQPMIALSDEGEISYHTGVYCSEICVKSEAGKQASLRLYDKTGKVIMEE